MQHPLKVFILGVNGFIGSTLSECILNTTDWEIIGMDIEKNKLDHCIGNPRFQFTQGDIRKNTDWISKQVEACDVVLPLVAVATPSTYVSDPLFVFELDFEANLSVVRDCVKYKKHLIFPSTSEVYGMSTDTPFDEEKSNLVLGPICKSRWIYSCSKQMMDRIIHAYGEKKGLNYTLFRPFNWIGGRQDSVFTTKEGSARVLTQFIGNILRGDNIKLVDGGKQKRCFTYIDDGIDGIIKIIKHRNDSANRRIFNLGNPDNNYSIRELADMLIEQIKTYPKYKALAEKTTLIDMPSAEYYGEGYQDVSSRIPSIDAAQKHLDWSPKVDMATALKLTLDYHLK